MGNIIDIGCITRLDIPIEKVLDAAKDELTGVVLLGWDNNGELYFSSTMADGGEVIWLLEKCKQLLLRED